MEMEEFILDDNVNGRGCFKLKAYLLTLKTVVLLPALNWSRHWGNVANRRRKYSWIKTTPVNTGQSKTLYNNTKPRKLNKEKSGPLTFKPKTSMFSSWVLNNIKLLIFTYLFEIPAVILHVNVNRTSSELSPAPEGERCIRLHNCKAFSSCDVDLGWCCWMEVY